MKSEVVGEEGWQQWWWGGGGGAPRPLHPTHPPYIPTWDETVASPGHPLKLNLRLVVVFLGVLWVTFGLVVQVDGGDALVQV